MSRVVAVTGGARGIGRAIADACAAAGMRAVTGDVEGGDLPLDVTSTESFAAFLDAVEASHGPIDVLVNNAGVMWVGRYDEEPDEVARRQIDVNLHGVIRGMKLAAPRMRERGRGHIVNIASAASKVGPPGEATYAATKHAVYGYSLAVRGELHGSGVEVSVVMPVVVQTELAAGTSGGATRPLAPEDVAKAVVAAIEKPRFEVFVPRRINALTRLVALLPERGRALLYRRIVPDQNAETDQAQRSDYERRRFGA